MRHPILKVKRSEADEALRRIIFSVNAALLRAEQQQPENKAVDPKTQSQHFTADEATFVPMTTEHGTPEDGTPEDGTTGHREEAPAETSEPEVRPSAAQERQRTRYFYVVLLLVLFLAGISIALFWFH